MFSEGDVIDIWTIDLISTGLSVERLRKVLSPEEQRRADRFRFERDRRRYIICRSRLRFLLGQYIGCPAERVGFVYGQWGKPHLDQAGGCWFNVAHSHERALIGVAWNREIGIDLECMRPMPDAEQLAEHFFSEKEKLAIRQTAHREECFFQIWARKEAFIKALGKGLSQPLDQFHVLNEKGETVDRIPDPEKKGTVYQIQDIDIHKGYSAALCVQGENSFTIRYRSLEEEERDDRYIHRL
ncbi:4'-phosphopantetheinyl transferase superfamily protein [Kroppenstedtia pulmonis]|uniref:4'-phosphopantetheinyl transferase superfamily protein n=1 Tax=Kroppenstedtia pulmonis TaxID=1380685 RepID=A0A7D4BQR5_9BACL|nr:4'-phosphopantetheinyl transferase superfamily protein [Kroppenstedtia pulmonis]QKG85031.1 4'-phosphopantetheinyl transferase superfamily protein [Kroppenstedtia pulmonis]